MVAREDRKIQSYVGTAAPAVQSSEARPLFCRRYAADDSYGDLLYTDKLKESGVAMLILKAQLNNLVRALHQGVESLGLGMASPQGRHGPNIVALLVPLDDNSELARRFHMRILAWKKTQTKSGTAALGCPVERSSTTPFVKLSLSC
jgi:hypothetical protein